jgi:lipoprotein-anchoring transpeptidase ErfK/SrfK
MRKSMLVTWSLFAVIAVTHAEARQSGAPVDLLKSSYHLTPDNIDTMTRPDRQMDRRMRAKEARSRTASLDRAGLSAWEQGPGTRKRIRFTGVHKAGSIIVSTRHRKLLYVLEDGSAMMYGVGVGRPGFTWGGKLSVSRKAEWPSWTPPEEMLQRQPELPRFMEGGPRNPLGARALYLGSSLYRIHGTNQAHTIGEAVSSGCFRMMNSDVVDLYNRVRVGAPVYIYQ